MRKSKPLFQGMPRCCGWAAANGRGRCASPSRCSRACPDAAVGQPLNSAAAFGNAEPAGPGSHGKPPDSHALTWQGLRTASRVAGTSWASCSAWFECDVHAGGRDTSHGERNNMSLACVACQTSLHIGGCDAPHQHFGEAVARHVTRHANTLEQQHCTLACVDARRHAQTALWVVALHGCGASRDAPRRHFGAAALWHVT